LTRKTSPIKQYKPKNAGSQRLDNVVSLIKTFSLNNNDMVRDMLTKHNLNQQLNKLSMNYGSQSKMSRLETKDLPVIKSTRSNESQLMEIVPVRDSGILSKLQE
jgi:hypothetical protein